MDGKASNHTLFSETSSQDNTADQLEQYLTPVLSQTPMTNFSSSKDDFLSALLSLDPQQPNEAALTPMNSQQLSNDHCCMTAIANGPTNSTTITNNSGDDFFSLLDNTEFFESLNDTTTIDSLLPQNSENVIKQSFSSKTTKCSESAEKAISEIYQILVTSFDPGEENIHSIICIDLSTCCRFIPTIIAKN